MAKQLIVNLKTDGTVAAETVGMSGDECLTYINALEDLLDATTTSSSFTEEYAAVRTDTSTGNTQQDHQ